MHVQMHMHMHMHVNAQGIMYYMRCFEKKIFFWLFSFYFSPASQVFPITPISSIFVFK